MSKTIAFSVVLALGSFFSLTSGARAQQYLTSTAEAAEYTNLAIQYETDATAQELESLAYECFVTAHEYMQTGFAPDIVTGSYYVYEGFAFLYAAGQFCSEPTAIEYLQVASGSSYYAYELSRE